METVSQSYLDLKKEQKKLKNQFSRLEDSLPERFLFYDLTRKIAPVLDKEELFSSFAEEIKRLGRVDIVRFTRSGNNDKGVLKFELDDFGEDILEVGTKSKNAIEYMSYFVKLLRLCLERIKLYNELQELSILDSLTKVYNRRYFMGRYRAEFQRAEKFKLNLAFLMFDIDYFKNKDPLMNSLYQQIWKYNRNVLLVIAGYTGTGKSWLAVKIASLLDPTFTKETMKDRIITSPTAFLKILSNEDDSRLQKEWLLF